MLKNNQIGMHLAASDTNSQNQDHSSVVPIYSHCTND